MSEEDASRSAKLPTQEEFDTIQNRIQLALAKRENIVKSWTASSSRKEPTKTDEQLDAEDAALFRNEPPYLGVGAPIPSHFLVSDAARNNKSLRAKFFPTKGLKGSKPRDYDEKVASAKRGLNEESSDDEGGRSNLGKAKKLKIAEIGPAPTEEVKNVVKQNADADEMKDVKGDKSGIMKAGKVDHTLATPPTTPEKGSSTTTQTKTEQEAKQISQETEYWGPNTNQIEVAQDQEQKEEEEETTPSKPINAWAVKRQAQIKKYKLKKKLYKKRKQEEKKAKLAVETTK